MARRFLERLRPSGQQVSQADPSTSAVAYIAKRANWRRAKKARMSGVFALRHPPPPTKRDGGVGRIPREKPRSLRFWRSIWRRGGPLVARAEGRATDGTQKTRIRISLVVFRVRSVFNPWLKVGPE